MGMTLAERKFREKVAHELGAARQKEPAFGLAASAEDAEQARREQERPLPLNLGRLAKAFEQYGTYLELVGQDEPLGEVRTFQWPGTEEQAA